MIPTLPVPSLHVEYRLWINELNFYKEEIRIFEDHLAALVSRNTDRNFAAQAEHFQNQFFLQKEVIDRIKHELGVSERQLAAFVKDHAEVGFESVSMDNHGKLRKDMSIFRNIYKELKEEFRRFEAQWS